MHACSGVVVGVCLESIMRSPVRCNLDRISQDSITQFVPKVLSLATFQPGNLFRLCRESVVVWLPST